jgi:hypothetical protein
MKLCSFLVGCLYNSTQPYDMQGGEGLVREFCTLSGRGFSRPHIAGQKIFCMQFRNFSFPFAVFVL